MSGTGYLCGILLFSAALLTSCGGGSSSSTPPANTGGTPSSTPATLPTPVAVTVSGSDISGIDIAVPSPAAAAPVNAELLGVAAVGAGGTASNTGAQIHQGTTMKVLLFGTGLSGSLLVNIGGPNDIAISNIRSITATDGTPGVAFDATVSGSAALGGRTVILTASNNDVTTFTGGLEVIP